MSAATASTFEVLSRYLEEHLAGTEVDVTPQRVTMLAFRVGPFRFLCPSEALLDTLDGEPCAGAIAAAELIPAPYRAQAAVADDRQTVRLRGGRIEIRGCRIEGPLQLDGTSLITRGPRADAPWICATTREPPAFVLDPDATRLHVMRRSRSGEPMAR